MRKIYIFGTKTESNIRLVKTIWKRYINSRLYLNVLNIKCQLTDLELKMGELIFCDCKSLKIYCEATSKPELWDNWWNSKDAWNQYHEVKWGYKTK